MTYKCLECGYIFGKPKKIIEDRTPGGAFEGFDFIYKVCPYCNGEYDEAVKCDECGQYDYEKSTLYFKDKRLCKNCCAKINSF